MTTTAPIVDTFSIADEILVVASAADTFDSIITPLGEDNETPDGKSIQCGSSHNPAVVGIAILATAMAICGASSKA